MGYTDKDYFTKRLDAAEYKRLTGNSDEQLYEAIKTADSTIDSYLANVYSELPLASPPDVIRDISYKIAYYNLYFGKQPNNIPQWIIDVHDTAMTMLRDLSSKRMKLSTDKNIPEAQKETTVISLGQDLKMSRDKFV